MGGSWRTRTGARASGSLAAQQPTGRAAGSLAARRPTGRAHLAGFTLRSIDGTLVALLVPMF